MGSTRTASGTARSRAVAKLRLIAGCDFCTVSKFRYAFHALVRRLWPRIGRGTRKYRLSGGRAVELRKNSTDWKVFEEIFLERIYDRHAAAIPRGWEPAVLIDVGANVGLSAIALAEILRPEFIVAVEPGAGSFAMLNRNLRLAGLADRAATVQAFAGAGRGFAKLLDSGYGAWGMRMGPAASRGIPVMTIADVISLAGSALAEGAVAESAPGGSARARAPDKEQARKVILKCDIEGSERQLFEHLRMWDRLVDFVILELHTEFLSAAEFHACLEGSRYRWRMHGEIPPGAVLAVLGLERLGEKPEALRHAAR
jgi:FkbM family methyltransferase